MLKRSCCSCSFLCSYLYWGRALLCLASPCYLLTRQVSGQFTNYVSKCKCKQNQLSEACLNACRNFFAYIYQYGCFGKTGKQLLFTFAQSEGYINGTTKVGTVALCLKLTISNINSSLSQLGQQQNAKFCFQDWHSLRPMIRLADILCRH